MCLESAIEIQKRDLDTACNWDEGLLNEMLYVMKKTTGFGMIENMPPGWEWPNAAEGGLSQSPAAATSRDIIN